MSYRRAKTCRGFQELYHDSSGLWQRAIGRRASLGKSTQFHFIEVTDMDDACGRDNEGHPRYVIELNEVNLREIGDKTVRDAMNSCGRSVKGEDGKWRTETADEVTNRDLAEACHSYGAKAPLYSVSTNDWHQGWMECRRESYRLLRDPLAYLQAMDRSVNAIGSTAREYMQGDLRSGMFRGVQAGDPKAEVVTRMHYKPEVQDEVIAAIKAAAPIGGAIRLDIKVKDPDMIAESGGDVLPYARGFMDALAGRAHADGAVAECYTKGYKLGVEVRSGDKPLPYWAGGPLTKYDPKPEPEAQT